jgi:hypothetical protein
VRFSLQDAVKAFALALAVTFAGASASFDQAAAGKDMQDAAVETPADTVDQSRDPGKDMKDA